MLHIEPKFNRIELIVTLWDVNIAKNSKIKSAIDKN